MPRVHDFCVRTNARLRKLCAQALNEREPCFYDERVAHLDDVDVLVHLLEHLHALVEPRRVERDLQLHGLPFAVGESTSPY